MSGVASGARGRLAFAALAVLLAAADTYVVVLALPSMMGDLAVGLDELHRATPVVSLFLLGYVAVLPLLGRVSDVAGRLPVLAGCLAVFAVGSAVTAVGDDLGVVVAGRFLQGLGGGGLVPVAFGLVADTWPEGRRGLPLGVVGAVQEIGSVLGPVYGAVVVTLLDWRWVFWLNLALALLLLLALSRGRARRRRLTLESRSSLAASAAGLAVLLGLVALARPAALVRSVEVGGLLVPLVGDASVTAPMALLALALLVVALLALAPLLAGGAARAGRRERGRAGTTRDATARADLPGAALLAGALGCVVLAFASADPERAVLGPRGPALLAGAAALAVALALRERRAAAPLVDPTVLRPPAAWGALAVSFALGGALMAALVDVPFFARATVHPDSQVAAALVLVRFLAPLPLGALVGGAVSDRVGPRLTAGTGLLLATGSFVAMSRWEADALERPGATVALVAAGTGFGLAVAPVNAAALAVVRTTDAGLVSALVVVARTAGMLVGLSLLTAVGLRRFAAAAADLPSPLALCPRTPTDCPPYADAVRDAVLTQLTTVFAGAAGFAAVAAVLALVLLRPPTRVPA